MAGDPESACLTRRAGGDTLKVSHEIAETTDDDQASRHTATRWRRRHWRAGDVWR